MPVVLGIDPGLTRCGFGVVESLPGRRVRLVEVGVIRSSPERDVTERVQRIAGDIRRLVTRHRPDGIAVERVFAQHNVASVMGVAHIIGATMLIAGDAGVPLAMHTPSEVKAAVTGSGTARKPQVQHMVARLLGVDEVGGPPDAADALAVAICECLRPTGERLLDGRAAASETPAQRAWREARTGVRGPGSHRGDAGGARAQGAGRDAVGRDDERRWRR